MSNTTNVKAAVRKDGTKVRAHERRTSRPSQSPSQATTEHAAAAAAAASRSLLTEEEVEQIEIAYAARLAAERARESTIGRLNAERAQRKHGEPLDDADDPAGDADNAHQRALTWAGTASMAQSRVEDLVGLLDDAGLSAEETRTFWALSNAVRSCASAAGTSERLASAESSLTRAAVLTNDGGDDQAIGRHADDGGAVSRKRSRGPHFHAFMTERHAQIVELYARQCSDLMTDLQRLVGVSDSVDV